MIKIYVNHQMFAYDMFHIVKAYFPGEEIEQQLDETSTDAVRISLQYEEGVHHFALNAKEVLGMEDRKLRKRYVNQKVYKWLSMIAQKELSWGIMTGVRPTKPMMQLLEQGMTADEVIAWMQETYCVTEDKAKLGVQVAQKEQELLAQLDYKDGYSLYIGIPFCPTTCSYCSFTSHSISEWAHRVDEYLDAVCKELDCIASVSKEKKLNTIYIGGGTPTTLTAKQMDRLLTFLETHFSYEYLKEITVEAGRPDSITKEKLEVLQTHGIQRISINPQTMQQKTLDLIGRKHTVEDVRRVYQMARELGFENINMDLIAGLPEETVEDMENTLREILAMKPDSLTVHALAMKRTSRLSKEQKGSVNQQTWECVSQMIELARQYASEMELEPYYLYRQKNIAGNFENVGYAKVDKAGIYNILIMEEKQSIVAVGAGASTKIVLPDNEVIIDEKTGNVKKIVRSENVKDVEQYMNRIDEMIKRKGELLWH